MTTNDKSKSILINIIERRVNACITGGAGTGKSYEVQQAQEKFPNRLSITSTTGISALAIGGMTIHRLSGIGGYTTLDDFEIIVNSLNWFKIKRGILKIRTLMIDEVSMMASSTFDLLDAIFKEARSSEKPFGGIPIIITGDFCQLPPIIKEETEKTFVFESEAYKNGKFEVVNLTKVYRQNDINFIKALNYIRLGIVNKHVQETLSPRIFLESSDIIKNDIESVRIMAVKRRAVSYNESRLHSMQGKTFTNKAILHGKNFYKVKELARSVLSPEVLNLKIGCRVMITSNSSDHSAYEFVNGDCGIFKGFSLRESKTRRYHEATEVFDLIENCNITKYINDPVIVTEAVIELDRGATIRLSKKTWSSGNIVSTYNNKKRIYSDRYEQEFRQYPLMLAYAISIHKSQGMSLDNVIVDCASIFADGQFYVALSRAKTLNGLKIINYNRSHVKTNLKALNFYHSLLIGKLKQIKKESSYPETCQTL